MATLDVGFKLSEVVKGFLILVTVGVGLIELDVFRVVVFIILFFWQFEDPELLQELESDPRSSRSTIFLFNRSRSNWSISDLLVFLEWRSAPFMFGNALDISLDVAHLYYRAGYVRASFRHI